MINYSFSIANFEYFLLILVRIASFVYIAPFLEIMRFRHVSRPAYQPLLLCLCTIS